MRVTNRIRRLHDERGATVAIVAISTIALMGMVVLVVDVGGLLTLRRQLVGATDSAALAAAQSCALSLGGEASAKADEYAQANIGGATRFRFDPVGCGVSPTGEITVGYKQTKELFFAPILGVQDSSPVGATATAMWGPTLAGGDAMPVTVNMIPATNRVSCIDGVTFPAECNFWFDGSSGINSGNQWGFMNLNRWDVSSGASCSGSSSSALRGWIQSGGIDLEIDSPPLYACAQNGSRSNWYSALNGQIGDTFLFPVNNPAQAITSGSNDKYAIVGFAKMELNDLLDGDDPAAVGTPGVAPVDDHCRDRHRFRRRGEVLALWTLNDSDCPAGAIPDTISDLQLSIRFDGRTWTIPPSSFTYTYDPVLQEITWHLRDLEDYFDDWDDDDDEERVTIDFDWHIDGVPPTNGKCGSRPANPSATCATFLWDGPDIAGHSPGVPGTLDFGLRAIRLDETN